MSIRESVYDLPRIHLPKLSEKGFEQRSKHEFGRYTDHEMGQKEPFGSLWGYAASASETFRTVSPGTSVNRIRRRAPGRACRVSRHASCSSRARLTIPPYGTLDGFPEWCRLLAEGSREVGGIQDERFLELVAHLDRLANDRVEQTYSPQQELRWRLHACWLAGFLEDHLYELARRDRL